MNRVIAARMSFNPGPLSSTSSAIESGDVRTLGFEHGQRTIVFFDVEVSGSQASHRRALCVQDADVDAARLGLSDRTGIGDEPSGGTNEYGTACREAKTGSPLIHH